MDLVSILVGEGDMEVVKVKCFYVVIIGYVFLIFNFGNNCDYSKFLE